MTFLLSQHTYLSLSLLIHYFIIFKYIQKFEIDSSPQLYITNNAFPISRDFVCLTTLLPVSRVFSGSDYCHLAGHLSCQRN